MNLKITVCIFLVFAISFSSFAVFANTFPTGLDFSQKNFFAKEFSDKKKIILLGSSHVGQLNTTYITNYLNKNDIEVFNLAYNSDTPERRSRFLNEMIALKPTVVIYGVSYRDFQTPFNESPLPDPKYFFNNLSNELMKNDITTNPKLITLNFIRNVQNSFVVLRTEEKILTFDNTPFFSYNIETQTQIANEIELKKQSQRSEASKFSLEAPDKNKQAEALINLINEFEQNNIKVVLFLTPLNKYYLAEIPDSQHIIFNSIINHVINETGVSVYDLRYKYSEMPIWANISHVAFNKDSLIYSEDIAKIIEKEILDAI
ncbi:MAG: hypothetical protein ABI337_06665 [Nitrososphaera sp.]